jgi:hypothetical protein
MRAPTNEEFQFIFGTMCQYNSQEGWIGYVNDKPVFFDSKPTEVESFYITKNQVFKVLNPNYEPPCPVRAECAAVGEDVWSTNAMEYATVKEAKEWLDGLKMRWFGYDMARVVSITHPHGEKVVMDDPLIYQNFRS